MTSVALLAGITSAAIVLTPIPSAAAQAADAAKNLPPLITHYGAIAYGQDGSQGKARRHLSKLGAQQQALQRCGDSTCTVVTTFTRCGAVAHDGAYYHGGVGLSRGMAEANAISRLGRGWIVDWACN
ncbi:MULTISPECIES: DUF4189 domain-containing protein [Mycobacterium]|jgi:hypothetical protein|uniref:DUF4189 domain-containing protein n=1 Tax=Mycobacterium gordonae TaxID=1778 RepID=A0A1A6BLF4_MYCGO|nr:MULTISPECIES: DUF4189 domain-containing protein [Mycobacterium]MBI2702557.1 DUF4189 domain-containing protein [Mycobacterium sp.]MBX9981920.1 DUF4189 domain-containing protein [Mycobacterium gordonae]MCQ4362647.1 DUF4189 domain-containing protein [Mycobacterium gordonae]MCV7004988.1 DUF4189 domain-containing protein [Mycobacterium gordonae]OBS03173.1 hypothetical protein A9W98_11110 [Mycobacterium gordonae]